jgi:hypothetical protein
MQKMAYNGTDFMPFSKPKFFCEMRMEYGQWYCFAKIFILLLRVLTHIAVFPSRKNIFIKNRVKKGKFRWFRIVKCGLSISQYSQHVFVVHRGY